MLYYDVKSGKNLFYSLYANISCFLFLRRHCWYISPSNCRPWARQFHPFIPNIKRKNVFCRRHTCTADPYTCLCHSYTQKHGTVPRHTINSPMSTLTARGDPELLWGIVSDLWFFRPDIIHTVILPFRWGFAERCGVRAVGGEEGPVWVRSPTLSWLMTALATLTERDQRSNQQLLHNSTPARRQPPATLLCLAGTRDASKHVHSLTHTHAHMRRVSEKGWVWFITAETLLLIHYVSWTCFQP